MTASRTSTAAPLALGLGLLAATAHADFVPIDQTRTVSGTAYAQDDYGEDSDAADDAAKDFGPFVSAASGYAEVGGAYGSGGSNQNSVITASGVDTNGAAFANAGGWSDNGYGDGSGRSDFDLTFEITEDVDFTFDGAFAVYDNGGLSFSFTGPDGPVVDVDIEYDNETYADEAGTLTPGAYRLRATASGSAYGDEYSKDYAFAEWNFELVLDTGVPEDVNGDGGVDFDDVLLVLAAWGACDGCPEDVNGDGFVDFDDLLRILAAWT